MKGLRKLAIIILLVALVLSCCASIKVVSAGTTVGGSIDGDTTWTKAGSPYTLTADVEVSVKTTLTIQAGVTVNLQGYTLRTGWGYDEKADQPLRATLITQGTSDAPVRFNNGKISLEHSEDSTVEYSVLSATSITVMYGSPSISYCTITGTGSGTGILCGASESPEIVGNTISGWSTGIQTGADTMGGGARGHPQINQNTLTGNQVGVLIILVDYGVGSWDFPKIVNNTINGNSKVGMDFEVSGPRWKGGSVEEVVIENNNIYRNPVNAKANAGSTLIARNNWWGTADAEAIQNSMSGDVVYEPVLLAPYNKENPQLVTPTPVALLPTTQPTVSSIPTQADTSANQPNGELNQVETWILYALTVIIVLLTVLIALVLKKRN
jgi:hypothetical protein